MLLHGHKTSTKTPNLRAQGLARAGPDASADLASLLYAAASQHTAAAAREATAAGAARPAEARACSQPAPRSPEFTASGIAAARLGSARLAHRARPGPPLAQRTPGRPRQTYRAAGPSQREARPGTKRRHPAPPADPLVAAARPAPSARASQPLERFLRPHFRPALSQSLPLYREEAESRQR